MVDPSCRPRARSTHEETTGYLLDGARGHGVKLMTVPSTSGNNTQSAGTKNTTRELLNLYDVSGSSCDWGLKVVVSCVSRYDTMSYICTHVIHTMASMSGYLWVVIDLFLIEDKKQFMWESIIPHQAYIIPRLRGKHALYYILSSIFHPR